MAGYGLLIIGGSDAGISSALRAKERDPGLQAAAQAWLRSAK